MSQITPQILRTATLLLTLCVASAASADQQLPAAADLDAAVEANADAAVERALADQLAAIQSRMDAQLAQSIDNRVGVQLAAATNDSVNTLLAVQQREVERRTEVAKYRMQSGSITLQQGVATGHHRFAKPFGQTPKIALGLRHADSDSARPAVALRVVSVDETGFDYVIRTRKDEWSQDHLTADWVAFASSATGS